jgi:hypothetical protein
VVTEFMLPHASVASSGDEYFQVLFNERPEGTDGDTPYFLMQRQFESPDGGRVYIESHDRDLCGHVRVTRAVLSADVLHLSLASRPPRDVAIRFQADPRRHQALTAALRIILGPRLQLA